MPLEDSSIDAARMREIDRFGIEFGACETSSGAWLDKGEIEKLIALVRQEQDQALHGRSDDDGGSARSADLFNF